MVDETPEALCISCPKYSLKSIGWLQCCELCAKQIGLSSAKNCGSTSANTTKIIELSAQFKQYFALFRRWIVRIHRPARESSDLRNVNRKRDRCIFYSAWVKRVCRVSKISSDCGMSIKGNWRRHGSEVVIRWYQRFFSHRFATRHRGFAAQFCRPQREKNLWHQGNLSLPFVDIVFLRSLVARH